MKKRDAQTGVAAGLGLTPADAAGQNHALRNSMESVALGHKKAPGDTTGRLSKMERAKRLELLRSLLQSCLGDETYKSLTKAGAQGGAHVEKAPELDPKLEAWAAEMEDVIEAWPKIEPAVRTGLMAIVRSNHGSVGRISANRLV